MNKISELKQALVAIIKQLWGLQDTQLNNVEVKLHVDKDQSFGDLTCNAAMVLAKELGKNPRLLAQELQQKLLADGSAVASLIKKIEIAGPGFINITLADNVWSALALELFIHKENCFTLDPHDKKLKVHVEFVSANPTGPLHLGHGRGGIIGDTMARVMAFLGHHVTKEFYINDAGNQVMLLGKSFQARCLQQLGHQAEIPEGGYAGEYLVDLAQECVAEFGDALHEKDEHFFMVYAKDHLLQIIQNELKAYGITFDNWFSEKSLHESGAIEQAFNLLRKADLLYEQDGALWFKATQFGDEKDRVIKKSSGELTYIAADIAYHKNKFDRGYDTLINVLGQDHHGYVKRLKATMQALGYDANKLDVILYQMVSIKENDVKVKMSKRAGTFTRLSDVIDAVGEDVARFFYLNRKPDAHLDFDLAVALKKTDENPVYYIHYAYVRTGSLLAKGREFEEIAPFLQALNACDKTQVEHRVEHLTDNETMLLKKMVLLFDVLVNISRSYQTHLLSYYSFELATAFHNYYTNNRILDPANIEQTKTRLVMVHLVRQTLEICLDLLGLSKPEKM